MKITFVSDYVCPYCIAAKESGERIILCDNGVKPDEGKCDEIAESNKNPYPLISDT